MKPQTLHECIPLCIEHYVIKSTACKNDIDFGSHCKFDGETNYVYELILDGELVYIGMSKNVNQRLKGHVTKFGDKMELGQTVECCCLSSAANLEQFAVNLLKPPWSKSAVGRPKGVKDKRPRKKRQLT